MAQIRISGVVHALNTLPLLTTGRQSFSQLKAGLGDLSAPTLSRTLKTLMDENWADKQEDGTYVAGPAYHQAARALCGAPSYLRILESIVEEVALESRETCAYVEWSRESFIFRAKHEMPDSYHHLGIGEKNGYPLGNGFGFAFYPWLSKEEQDALLSTKPQLTEAEVEKASNPILTEGTLAYRDKGLRLMAPIFSQTRLYADSPRVDETKYIAGILGISTFAPDPSEEEVTELLTIVHRAAANATERLSTR
ncbi:MAG: IclR family transcriptional regulator [Planctomycetota bacterium]|jgi:DNA-binding IclR family transcriptional regulator